MKTVRISQVYPFSLAVVVVGEFEICLHYEDGRWVYKGERLIGGTIHDRWYWFGLGYDQYAAIALVTAATTKIITHTVCKNGRATEGTLEGNTLSYEAKYGIEKVDLDEMLSMNEIVEDDSFVCFFNHV